MGTVNQSKKGDNANGAGTPGVNISYEAMEVMDSLPYDLPEEISNLDINDIIKNEKTLNKFIIEDHQSKEEKPLSYKSLLYLLHATIINKRDEARKMYKTAKDLTLLELNFKSNLEQLSSSDSEKTQKTNEFKAKKRRWNKNEKHMKKSYSRVKLRR